LIEQYLGALEVASGNGAIRLRNKVRRVDHIKACSRTFLSTAEASEGRV
jgi:hypothetical protein